MVEPQETIATMKELVKNVSRSGNSFFNRMKIKVQCAILQANLNKLDKLIKQQK